MICARSYSGINPGSWAGASNCTYSASGYTNLVKTYDNSTGILTAYYTIYSQVRSNKNWGGVTYNNNQSVDVYLIK